MYETEEQNAYDEDEDEERGIDATFTVPFDFEKDDKTKRVLTSLL